MLKVLVAFKEAASPEESKLDSGPLPQLSTGRFARSVAFVIGLPAAFVEMDRRAKMGARSHCELREVFFGPIF